MVKLNFINQWKYWFDGDYILEFFNITVGGYGEVFEITVLNFTLTIYMW